MSADNLQLLVRQPDNAAVLTGLAGLQQTGSNVAAQGVAVCSPDGTKIAAVSDNTVDVYDRTSTAKLLSLDVAGAFLLDWSKTGAFLTTAQKPSKGADGQPAKNIKVWDASSGSLVFEVGVKSVNKDSWPLLQWSRADEALYHGVTNTVHQYSRADRFKIAKKVPIKGVTTFQPCPAAGKQLIAAFIAETKGQPAVATVVDCSGNEPVTISRKSFFRATGASIMWNATGTACLIMATSETDATNQSYYGESKLHYLPAEASRTDAACSVQMPKDGPVHDVQWSPDGEYFVVIAGFMPAKVILHDNKCKAVYDLGAGPYSTARWNPFGRFLAIAGFGNLPGDIVFYNKLNKGVCKQMGATRSGSSVTAAWSPDGRYFLTATTAPRLRVDNNVRVFTYYGEKVVEKPFDTLYDATWLQPLPGTTYEDRPPSPERVAAAGSAAGAAASSNGAAKPAGAYRPPGARTLQAHLQAGAAAINGPTFSLAYDNSSKPGRITQQGKPMPPGAEFVSKAASKNAKKRANKKAKAGGEGGADGEQDEDEQTGSSSSAAVAAVTEQMSGAAVSIDSGDAAQKRIRALQKKLRQIQQLKERREKEGETVACGPRVCQGASQCSF
eukprot:GHUV01019817.1.p1 GENE.GHUV01019817.1~~GHUV01019817.1.p1  ORF type:complete len:612 (+),score=207.58 GHUV01019817.1:53-1888(+)